MNLRIFHEARLTDRVVWKNCGFLFTSCDREVGPRDVELATAFLGTGLDQCQVKDRFLKLCYRQLVQCLIDQRLLSNCGHW